MRVQLPTYFLVVVFADELNRPQQAAIEYLKTENEILKLPLKGRRLRLRDEDPSVAGGEEQGARTEVVGRGRVHRDTGNDSRAASSAGGD